MNFVIILDFSLQKKENLQNQNNFKINIINVLKSIVNQKCNQKINLSILLLQNETVEVRKG
jgi:hypothetical protein